MILSHYLQESEETDLEGLQVFQQSNKLWSYVKTRVKRTVKAGMFTSSRDKSQSQNQLAQLSDLQQYPSSGSPLSSIGGVLPSKVDVNLCHY